MAGRDLLTSAEVAALLSVSQRYVQRLAAAGILTGLVIQTGQRPMLRFRATDVVTFADRYVCEGPQAREP
jgi:excisionase family DNA binding protein